jgi:hypothetical protein
MVLLLPLFTFPQLPRRPTYNQLHSPPCMAFIAHIGASISAVDTRLSTVSPQAGRCGWAFIDDTYS